MFVARRRHCGVDRNLVNSFIALPKVFVFVLLAILLVGSFHGAAHGFEFLTTRPDVAGTAAGATLPSLSPPQFSHVAGFHTAAFQLRLSTSEPGATILYTLDGSEPLPENLGGRRYSYKQEYPFAPGDLPGPLIEGELRTFRYATPITIVDRSSEPNRLATRSTTFQHSPVAYTPAAPVFKGTVVRARTLMEGRAPSPVVTRTFFVTPLGSARYALPVVSLAMPEDSLFDYERGIYTAGIDYDKWRAANPLVPAGYLTEANYTRRGDDWEYPLHFEYLDPVQGLLVAQNLGFRIHGEFSRHYPQKSLRLYARNAYGMAGELSNVFFPNLMTSDGTTRIDGFQRLLLRNAGNDNQGPRLRDAAAQRILAPLGVDVQAYQPVIHFINGEYWGIIDIRERFDRFYVAAHHGIAPSDVAILSNEGVLEEGEALDARDFIALRDYIATHNMAQPVHYAHASARMDMENFIAYNVGNIFARTLDWPFNNVRIWRKSGPAGEEGAQSGSAGADGRWRWIFHDLDSAFGPPVDAYGEDTLLRATREAGDADWSTVMLRQLLKNAEFRARFIDVMVDNLNTTFHPQRTTAVLQEMYNALLPHYAEHVARWPNTLHTSAQYMQGFALQRPAYVREHLANYFQLPEARQLTVTVRGAALGTVQVNGTPLTPTTPGIAHKGYSLSWQGFYFPGLPVEIVATPLPGYEFAGWAEISGESSPTLAVDVATQSTLTAVFVPPAETLLHQVYLPLAAGAHR